MCGFLAVKNYDDNIKSKFIDALALQQHRGPDGTRIVNCDNLLMGFNRLSIIDLTEKSMQPTVYNNITLIFNGEIYNYKEIRSELKNEGLEFVSNGDAEVFAAAISYWGIKVASIKARGMWAVIAYDSITKKTLISRDRLGIKPLWYAKKNNKVFFSSEIKSILHFDEVLKTINNNMCMSFLMSGVQDEDDQTFYKDIYSFPKASFCEINRVCNDVSPSSYWKLDEIVTYSISDNYDALERALSSAMEQHMQSDVPVGLALSGGLDSSIICHYARSNKDLLCYSVDHPVAKNENSLINRTVKKWNLNHRYVSSKTVDTVDSINEIICSVDQPFRATQTVYQYALRKAARNDGVKVFLTGDGADEVFAGYVDCIPYYLANLIDCGHADEAEAVLKNMELFIGNRIEQVKDLTKKILFYNSKSKYIAPRVNERVEKYFFNQDACFEHDVHYYNKSQKKLTNVKDYLKYRLFKTPLPYWLRVEDEISMKSSVETRVPFLDHRLIEQAFKFSDEEFFRGNTNKAILRKISQEYLPSHIKNNKTKYQRPGSTYRLVFDVLSDYVHQTISEAERNHLLNLKQCMKEFVRDKNNNNQSRTDFWFRVFIYLRWSESI